MSKNSVYESIMTGLNEALEDAQSKKPIREAVEQVIIANHQHLENVENSGCSDTASSMTNMSG